MGYHFALSSETPDVTTSDLYRLAGALEINGKHCAQAWSKQPAAIDVIEHRRRLPPGVHPIVFVDGSDTEGSGLAYHYYDPLRPGPAARVFCGKATGFNTGHSSVAELASHELVEAMVDPMVNLWVDHPDPARDEGVEMALEIADMVQTQYLVEARGDKWQMANFVTPDYFRQWLARDYARLQAFFAAGGKLDWSGELTRPGEIGPGGYAILRERKESGGWRTWPENWRGARAPMDPAKGKAHVLARSRIRGAVD